MLPIELEMTVSVDTHDLDKRYNLTPVRYKKVS